jgi:phosphopantothenoylcysteine decarboxylase/phosphopantothenate--cysteine ligase
MTHSNDKESNPMQIVITAGPTYERIDPVRFIGNYSTGKMGFALAEACAQKGWNVTLVAGVTSLQTVHPNIRRVNVESADEMFEAVMREFPACDGALFCAAVADFTPVHVSENKIKATARHGISGKDDRQGLTLELRPTRDIAAEAGRRKHERQFLAGFALETDNETAHALDKMQRKRFDFIVLNSLNDAGAGFGGDTNKITILKASGEQQAFDLKSKQEVAGDIVKEIEALYREKMALPTNYDINK